MSTEYIKKQEDGTWRVVSRVGAGDAADADGDLIAGLHVGCTLPSNVVSQTEGDNTYIYFDRTDVQPADLLEPLSDNQTMKLRVLAHGKPTRVHHTLYVPTNVLNNTGMTQADLQEAVDKAVAEFAAEAAAGDAASE